MTTTDVIRLCLIIVIAIWFLFRLAKSRGVFDRKVSTTKNQNFYNINEGNQTELIYAPDYDPHWFEKLDKKYSWERFDVYDNRFFEYMYQLFDTLPKIAKVSSEDELFRNCTRGQKVFWSILAFTGDIDNGGVQQFFQNRKPFSLATLEAFRELKLEQLAIDYEMCLNDYRSNRNILKSGGNLENYFYEKEFKLILYKTVVEYIDSHIEQFVRK